MQGFWGAEFRRFVEQGLVFRAGVFRGLGRVVGVFYAVVFKEAKGPSIVGEWGCSVKRQRVPICHSTALPTLLTKLL